MHETGIHYEDVVQVVDVTWNRVVGVRHSQSKSVITTRTPLAQITVSRSHEDYHFIVNRLAALQAEFGFDILDTRTLAESTANDS